MIPLIGFKLSKRLQNPELAAQTQLYQARAICVPYPEEKLLRSGIDILPEPQPNFRGDLNLGFS